MALKDTYFTISEAAEELKVTRQTVSRWIASGILPAEKVGRETLIDKVVIRHYYERRRDEAIADYFVDWTRNSVINHLRRKFRLAEGQNVEELKSTKEHFVSRHRSEHCVKKKRNCELSAVLFASN